MVTAATKIGYNSQIQKRIEFTPQMFGAKGDWNGTTGTDDTQAIIDMVAEAAALNVLPWPNSVFPTLQFPYLDGGYLTSGPIVIPEQIHVLMDVPIFYDGSENAPAIEIGTAGVVNREADMRFKVKRLSISEWSEEESIAVKVINADACKISISELWFTIGLQCMGSGAGFAHNRIQLQRMIDNFIHVDCTNETSGGVGWCNENKFMGGRLSNSSNTKIGQARYGVRITSKDGTNTNNNNNVFDKLSHELDAASAGSADSVPFLCVHGTQNRSIANRSEGNGSVFAIEHNNSLDNDWDHTHTQGAIVYVSKTIAASVSSFGRQPVSNRANRLVFDSGPMNENAVMYDGTQIHIPNVQIYQSGNGSKSVALSGITWFHSEDFTVDTGNDQLIDTGHLLQDGDEFYITTSAADAPDGLPVATKFFCVNAVEDRFEGSLTRSGAAVNILDAGTGTHTYHSRARWIDMSASRGVGVFIDTVNCKQFVVELDTESGFGGRVLIQCYDADGVQLTDNPSDRYVKGRSQFIWLPTTMGGTYRPGNDATAETPFVVGSDVKSIGLMVSGGTANIRVRKLKVWTPERGVASRTWLDYQVPEPGVPVATQAPTTGMYLGPLKIWDHTPVISEAMGWMLPTGGAPGTWLNMPEYGALA